LRNGQFPGRVCTSSAGVGEVSMYTIDITFRLSHSTANAAYFAHYSRGYYSSLSRDCLGFGECSVRVREKHTDACGGEPDVSPVLFFLKLRKRDGHAVTTAYDGEHYRPLKPQPAK
jgi:hypothetical protein